VDFDTMLAEADILSIHVHLTESTRHIIDRDALSRMKDGVVLINTSRGALIDEDAFLEALRSGKVAAAGVDTINGEWNENIQDHPLVAYARDHDNLLISPHVGGITYEAQEMAYARAAEHLHGYLKSLTPEDLE
jgi:phosphoglycerate dehydrogenase-like enzyme